MQNPFMAMRDAYLPKEVKAIFVLEFPPKSENYFYDPAGEPSEALFRSLMQVLFGLKFKTKEEGLRMFQEAGYLVANPVYKATEKMPDSEANALILKNYQTFKEDLGRFTKKPGVKVMLIKANIFRLLGQKLLDDGFPVVNNGNVIPFPLHYHFKMFQKKIRAALDLKD